MILKAIITQVPQEGNEYQVRIPYFEDNTGSKALYTALLCIQPGEYYGYEVGDCVIIGFEDTRLNTPIILGKLFTGETPEVEAMHKISNLQVTGAISLPSNTTIGGYSTLDIFKNSQKDYSISGGGGGSSTIDYEPVET